MRISWVWITSLIFYGFSLGSRGIWAVTVPPLGSSPLPTMNLGCVDDEEGTPAQDQKFYNETCQTDADCFAQSSSSSYCNRGRCDCRDGYAPEKQRTTDASKRRLWVCTWPPSADQPCTSLCQKPYTCALRPSSSSDASHRQSSSGVTPMTSATDLPLAEQWNDNQRFCLCKSPFVSKSGDCRLDCKPDEYYHDYKCKKRCAVNEIQIDGDCKKTSALGQPCGTKAQCISPFAQCENGKCVCPGGFKRNAQTGACDPVARHCPFGDPLQDKSSMIIPCTTKKPSPPTTPPTPSKKPRGPSAAPSFSSAAPSLCPITHFCVVAPEASEDASGHCCLKPKESCAYGDPHPNATCGSGDGPSCPIPEYQCQKSTYFGFETAACCPVVCSGDTFHAGDRCYSQRKLGDTCEISEQCSHAQAVCDNGICTCPKGYAPINDPPTYCGLVCTTDQVQINEKCIDRLNLGDSCDPSASHDLCPNSAHCSKKQRKCICDCGYGRVDPWTCGQQPTCNFSDGASTPIPTPTTEFNITGFTYCRVPSSSNKVVANALRECPKGQYCAEYLSDVLGVCCPRPNKPLCPDGSTPPAKCDPNTPKACGGKGTCYQYLHIAAPRDVTDGHICCYHK